MQSQGFKVFIGSYGVPLDPAGSYNYIGIITALQAKECYRGKNGESQFKSELACQMLSVSCTTPNKMEN